MRGRFFLLCFLIVAIFCGCFYYFKSIKPTAQHEKGKNPTVVQILPFPIITAGEDGKKDNSLYELLINKTNKIISINNGRLDFSEFFAKKDIYFDNLFLNFSYDNKNSRVNLSGHIENGNNIVNVSGYYALTDKNNIAYKLDFDSVPYQLSVNAVYTANSNNIDEGSMKGDFTFKTVDFFNSLNEFKEISNIMGVEFIDNEQATITGEFNYSNQKFTITNANFQSNDLNFSLNMNSALGQNYDVKAELNITNLNIDNIIAKETRSGINKIISFVSIIVDRYGKGYGLDGAVIAQEITMKRHKLTNLNFTFNCDSEKNLNIKNLSVNIDESSKLSSSGILSKNEYRPIYKGNLYFESDDTKTLLELFNVKDAEEMAASHVIQLNSDIMMTPILLNLSNIHLADKKFDVEGDMRLSYYDNNFKAIYSNLVIDNFNANQDTIISRFINKYNFLTKSSDEEFATSILNFKRFKSIYDFTFNVMNLQYMDKVIDNGRAQIVLRPDIFGVQDLSVRSSISNFDGQLIIDVSEQRPYLSAELYGDNIDGNFITAMLLQGTTKKLTASTQEPHPDQQQIQAFDPSKMAYQLNNYYIDSFRFDKFDGFLKMKFNEINFGNEKYNNLDFDSEISDGLIKVKKLNMNMFSGYLQSVGNITLSPFAYNVAFSLNGTDVKSIASNLFNSERFAGILNMTGNIYGKGNTVYEIINQSGGSLTFKALKFMFKRFNIDAVTNTYGTYIPDNFDTNLYNGITNFKSIEGKGTIENGLLKITNAEFSTNKVDGKLNAAYDLLLGTQTSIASLAFIDGAGKVDGFNISFVGPINNAQVKLGTASVN